MTIENIAIKMRMLANEIGGEHHSPKEAEKLLNQLADELSETNMQMSIKLHKCLEEIDNDYSDIDNDFRFLYLRQKNTRIMTYKELYNKALCKLRLTVDEVDDYRPASLFIKELNRQIPNAIIIWLKTGEKIIFIDK